MFKVRDGISICTVYTQQGTCKAPYISPTVTMLLEHMRQSKEESTVTAPAPHSRH